MKKIISTAGCIFAFVAFNGANAQSSAMRFRDFVQNEKDISKSKTALKTETAPAADSASSNVAAASAKNISKHAIRNFNKEYGNAGAAQWSVLTNGFVAYCKIDGVRNRVFYNKNGMWLHSVLDYGEKNLPKDVRAMVKRTYYDFAIEGANEIHVEDKIIYLVYIKAEGISKTVRICDDEMEVIASFSDGL